MKVGFLPPADFEATTLEEFMVLGHIMTATPPLNAIPAVVAAPPGIVTYNDCLSSCREGWSRRVSPIRLGPLTWSTNQESFELWCDREHTGTSTPGGRGVDDLGVGLPDGLGGHHRDHVPHQPTFGDGTRPDRDIFAVSLLAGAVWPFVLIGVIELSSVAIYSRAETWLAVPGPEDLAIDVVVPTR